MAYRDSGLHQNSPYGSDLRSETAMSLADTCPAESAGTLTGGLLIAVLMILGLVVGVGTLRVGGASESPAAPGSGAGGSASGWSGGTETAAPAVAPAY